MKYLATIPANPKTPDERTAHFTLKELQDLLGANVTREDISKCLKHLSDKKIKVPMQACDRTKEGQKELQDDGNLVWFVPLLMRAESKDKSVFAVRLLEELVPAVSARLQRYAVTSISDLQYLKGSPRAQALHRFLLMHHFNACVKWPDVSGGEIEVDIETLREELGMTGKSYDNFGAFHRELKKASVAVNQTYIKHSFEPGKKKPGTHEVSTLVFTYYSNPLSADATSD
jgi:hypothetical protein